MAEQKPFKEVYFDVKMSELREKSGSISSTDMLVSFLYELMRDGHVAPGVLEKIIIEDEYASRDKPEKLFSNGWLAEYAKNLSKRLTTHTPKVGVATIVWGSSTQFLIGKRLGSHGFGTWSVPGGHLEFGESIEECAIREVFEETGINIKEPRVIGLTNDVMDGLHYVTIWTDAIDLEGKAPKEKEVLKFSPLLWTEATKLPNPLFIPLENFKKNYPEYFKNGPFILKDESLSITHNGEVLHFKTPGIKRVESEGKGEF